MKKILSLIALLLIAFGLIGCENGSLVLTTAEQGATTKAGGNDTTVTNGGETTTKAAETSTTAEPTTTKKITTKSPQAALIDGIELTEGDQYTLNFWHIWGAQKSAVLDELLLEFKNYMKDVYGVTVSITSTSQSNYATLLDKTKTAIASGDNSNIPNIVIGYPDHFADYLKSGKIVALDKYIDSDNYGVDRDDFIQAYMEENNQFGGYTYSLPLSKSEEIMVYNKSALDAFGYTIPYDEPMTWFDLYELWNKETEIKVINSETGEPEIDEETGEEKTIVTSLAEYDQYYAQFKYLCNYDSTDNMFINFARQWKAPYTTSAGELLVTDNRTVQMLTYLEQVFQAGFLSVPLNYADTASYGSEYFQQQQMPFTIGSTAGVSYDVPTAISADVKYLFEACIAMVPQMTTDKDDDKYSMSVVQQGPNIAILDAGSDEEDLVAWLLIKYLTTMEQYSPDDSGANDKGFVDGQNNSARFGISTGYFPVTYSAYESALYTDYMSIGKQYFENGYSTEGFTPAQKAKLLNSQVAYVSYLQSGWLRYDPAFAATSSLFGSAYIRQQAGTCIEKVAKTPTYDAATALRELLDACTIAVG